MTQNNSVEHLKYMVFLCERHLDPLMGYCDTGLTLMNIVSQYKKFIFIYLFIFKINKITSSCKAPKYGLFTCERRIEFIEVVLRYWHENSRIF